MFLLDRFWETVRCILLLSIAILSVDSLMEKIAVMLVVSRQVVQALHRFIPDAPGRLY